jgi:hypothetical protein
MPKDKFAGQRKRERQKLIGKSGSKAIVNTFPSLREGPYPHLEVNNIHHVPTTKVLGSTPQHIAHVNLDPALNNDTSSMVINPPHLGSGANITTSSTAPAAHPSYDQHFSLDLGMDNDPTSEIIATPGHSVIEAEADFAMDNDYTSTTPTPHRHSVIEAGADVAMDGDFTSTTPTTHGHPVIEAEAEADVGELKPTRAVTFPFPQLR